MFPPVDLLKNLFVTPINNNLRSRMAILIVTCESSGYSDFFDLCVLACMSIKHASYAINYK